MGASVGATVGAPVGAAVSVAVGAAAGAAVVTGVGEAEGVSVGTAVGAAVGAGVMVQPPLAMLQVLSEQVTISSAQLRILFMSIVGAAVGDTVGTFVSPTFVGEAVGAGEHHIEFRLSIAMSPRMPPPRVAVTR